MSAPDALRVVHFNTNDVVGGAAKAAVRLHTALRNYGVASRMVVLNRGGTDPSITRVGRSSARLEASLLVRDAAHKAVQYTIKPRESFDFDLAAFSAPTRDLLFEAASADVLHLHWTRGLIASGQMRKMAAVSGAPVVWTLMDLAPIAGGCHYPGTCTKFASICGTCPVLRSSHAHDAARWTWSRRARAFRAIPLTVVACTRWIAQHIQRSTLLAEANCVTIPLAVDTQLFQPGDPHLARAVLGLPAGALIIFCGAQQFKAPRKGLREFIDTLGHLQVRLMSVPEIHERVLVVTAGGYDPSTDFPIGFPHVHLGHLGDDRVLALAHQAADIFLSPSLEDAGPMILNEALACGTPAVAFDTGGAAEWLGDGGAGIVADLGQTDQLAAGLATLLCDMDHRRDAGQRARALAVEHFSPTNVAVRYAELYATLQDHRRR